MAKRENVREKILKTAVELLGNCGIRKLAQPLIAKTAGVPQGHMTYYFPTRSQLLIAVAERSLESVAEMVLKKATSAGIKVRDSLAVTSFLIKNSNRTRMLVGLLVESDENPDLRVKLQEQIKFSRSLVAMSLNRGADDTETTIVHATIIGLGIQHYLDDSKTAGRAVDEALKYLAKNFRGKSWDSKK
jgi:AcrR family transcriptional regulator